MTRGPEVVLWRHGRTEWNASGRFQGQLESHLDEVGRAEASAAAAVLATRAPVRIVSSDSVRAMDTARVLADVVGLDVVSEPRLRELHVGGWGGLTHAEVREQFPDEYARWRSGHDVVREGGETVEQVTARALAVIDEEVSAYGDRGVVVLVTHGGTARAAVVAMLGLPAEARRTFGPLGNACWATIRRETFGWRLAEYNASATAPVGEPPRPEPAASTVPVPALGDDG